MTNPVSALRNWLRVVLPSFLLDMFLGYVALWSLFLLALLVTNNRLIAELFQFLSSLQLPAAFGYALFRVWYFNPIENPAYRDWIMTSAWHYPKRLPLGPLLPVAQDIVVVGCITAMFLVSNTQEHDPESFFRTYGIWIPAVIHLTVQGFFVCCSAILRGERFGTFVLPVLLALAMANFIHFYVVVAIVVLIGVATAVSLHRLLHQFASNSLSPQFQPLKTRLQLLGASNWPADQLLAGPQERLISKTDALLWSATVAWVGGCVTHAAMALATIGGTTPIDEDLDLGMPFITPLFFICAARIAIYCLRFHPPYGLFGRLSLGRLIIPGYDQVFVAPILCLAISLLLPPLLDSLGLPLELIVGFTLLLGLWILLRVGPTLADWQHTGHHRMVAGNANKKTHTKLG